MSRSRRNRDQAPRKTSNGAPPKTNRMLDVQRRKQLRAHYAARYRVRGT